MESVKNLRYKRTLFVGLGGAGAKTLRLLKEEIKKVNDGKVPGQIKFLLIDTNATDLANYRDFDCSEKVCIAVREPYARYKHDKGLKTHEYIPEGNAHSLLALERGAGQIRSNGHFAVIENQYSNKLAQVFRHAAEELEDIDVKGDTLERDPKIEVRLVFSIAGGTGSGTFLPISVLLRAAIKHCELTAYIYSATHYERIVEKSAKYAVMQNAYASLCELDYMMHFGLNNRYQKPITFNFGPEENQHIEQSNRPFEEVYYIDKITSLPTPDTVEFAYNEIDRMQKNTADALFIAATSIISSHTGTIDNVRQKVMEGQFDVNDKFAWVSALGMAELYLSQLGITDPKIVEAAVSALNARVGKTDEINPEINYEERNRIVSEFMREKWDESKGDKDGDPVLTKFISESAIRDYCRDYVVESKSQTKRYLEYNVTLDTVLKDKAKPSSSDTVAKLKKDFAKDLQDLVKDLLDNKKYEGKHGYGYHLTTVKAILGDIKSLLKESIECLDKEEKKHEDDEDKANKDAIKERVKLNKAAKQNYNKKFVWSKPSTWLGKSKEEQSDSTFLSDAKVALAIAESIPLSYRILKERGEKAKEVINGCIGQTENMLKIIDGWITLLNAALQYGDKHNSSLKASNSHNERKENRVEVRQLKVNEFKLGYDHITKIENAFKISSDKNKGQSIFEAISKAITEEIGNLKTYLESSLNGLKSADNDKKSADNDKKSADNDKKSQFNKEQRTPFQKSIDRLIDLSTPTMQIDGHGFGERVKADQFWYVMTDCGEDEEAESRDGRKKIKSESVGGLLKRAIEQNALDERVNLVHVSGWTNKAVLYRVLAAVPPYFVEGVCSSDCGGITLEGCYEELKKTKHTYTPFSHDELRKKLENARCVLKPHEETTDDVALEHWVNYMILGKINVEQEKNSTGKERQNMRGIYTVVSKSLGEHKVGEVVEPTKILTLGDGARVESFNMFARYCKTLIDENKEYAELIDPNQNEEYESMFILSPEEYMENILVGFYGFDRAVINKLPEDNSDKELIRKEMAFLEQRKQKFVVQKGLQELNQKIFDNHKESGAHK